MSAQGAVPDPHELPEPSGSYSHSVVAGNLLFTAGQGPFLPGSDQAQGNGIAEQTAVTLANLERVLHHAGSSLERVVKTTVYLADLADFVEFDRAYSEIFPMPFPARTTIGCDLDGFLVEIEAVATFG